MTGIVLQGHNLRQLDRQSPVEVSHHEALEVVGGEAAVGRVR